MRLVLKATGEEVKPGDVIKDFRGEEWIYLMPDGHKVHMQRVGSDWKQTFFASVFGVEFVE